MENNQAQIKQAQFLKKIEDTLPKNSSFVNELADVLGISTDSVYRRMRLETFLSIEEILLLCNHFRVSFDTYSNISNEAVTFSYNKMEPKTESFYIYLSKLVKDLETINQSKERQIIYASEDIPIFHHYRHPVLASFKMFYWMHAIMSVPELENEQFDAENIPEELERLGKRAIECYSQIPTIEIWTDTTVQSIIKQIEFFWESGRFKSGNDAISVCKALREEITSIQKQAEKGTKLIDAEIVSNNGEKNYQLYYSDVEITNNCVFVQMGSLKSVYLGHFTFNTMSTFSDTYCNETLGWLNTIMRKSVLISGVSEKQRYQLFRKYFKQIDDLEAKIIS